MPTERERELELELIEPVRAALADSSTGSVATFSRVVRGARPDQGLAVGRTRTICVRTRDSIVSVAHPNPDAFLPVAPRLRWHG